DCQLESFGQGYAGGIAICAAQVIFLHLLGQLGSGLIPIPYKRFYLSVASDGHVHFSGDSLKPFGASALFQRVIRWFLISEWIGKRHLARQDVGMDREW